MPQHAQGTDPITPYIGGPTTVPDLPTGSATPPASIMNGSGYQPPETSGPYSNPQDNVTPPPPTNGVTLETGYGASTATPRTSENNQNWTAVPSTSEPSIPDIKVVIPFAESEATATQNTDSHFENGYASSRSVVPYGDTSNASTVITPSPASSGTGNIYAQPYE